MSGAGWLGLALVVALLGVAVCGDGLSRYRYDALDPEHALEAPSRAHPLGTDALGRDVFARMAAGSRVSLAVAVGSTAVALLLGTAYGAIAGFAGGRLDGWMMRAVDVAYALPDVLVIILLTQVIAAAAPTGLGDHQQRLLALTLALGAIGWVGVARLVRGLVLQAREELWVEAARALGAAPARVLARHVLPNVIRPVLVTATLRIPAAILAESTVSFIGLGIAPPFASWGVLAADGFEAMRSYPHLILFPSAAILVTLLAFHLLGEALHARLDTRRSSSRAHLPV
jgi:oligopeptide transport system permease protein